MGDRVKRLHDCPHVPISYSIMTASPILEVTWFKCFDHDRANARYDQGGGMSDLHEPHARRVPISIKLITTQVVSRCPIGFGSSI